MQEIKEKLEKRIIALEELVKKFNPQIRDEHRIINKIFRRYSTLQKEYEELFGEIYIYEAPKGL